MKESSGGPHAALAVCVNLLSRPCKEMEPKQTTEVSAG